jgi:O-antigen ligase
MKRGRARIALERIRFGALVLGCAALFWQWDIAATDVFFGIGILLSLALWERGGPLLDLSWPQPLLLLFLTFTAIVSTLVRGSPRFFEITVYLLLAALALASALRRDPRRLYTIEAAVVIAGAITAVTVAAGAAATPLHIAPFQVLAYDFLRGQGLFKDPNVAGAFVACAYPLAAARSLRLRRGRVFFLLVSTAVFGAGAYFSYSRWALVLMALAVGATIVVLALRRDVRPFLVLGGATALAGVIAVHALPSYRFQAVQGYDENARLAAWRLAVEKTLERPLGWGAGSFEGLAVEAYGAASGWTSVEAPKPTSAPAPAAPESPNLVHNGAFDGDGEWSLPAFATTVDDPSSPTGHALRKVTTDKYQDPGVYIPVEPGQTYSFASLIKTDGTPALLIVHWRDAEDATISQVSSDSVTATTWTEMQLPSELAPSNATHAVLLLSNLEAGTQYFTAVRVVVGAVAPPWSASLQHVTRPVVDSTTPDVPVPASTHNTFLRLLVETGVPGFVTICTYWLLLLFSLWRLGRRSYPWSVAFTLVLLGGMTIDTLHWRQLWVYTAVAMAAFVASPAVASENPVRQTVAADAQAVP